MTALNPPPTQVPPTARPAPWYRELLESVRLIFEAARDYVAHRDNGDIHYEDAPADNEQYARRNNVWVPVADLLVGLYDQVADVRTPGGQPLDAASNYGAGDYYTLTETGVFSTSIPELSGLTAVPGDRIISDGSTWNLITATQSYLSAVVDDTAQGVITFDQNPVATPAAPTAADHLSRKDYVDGADAAHAGLGSADDVHGASTYTDQQDAAHVTDPDPHTQYVTKAFAKDNFSFAGYGTLNLTTPTATPAIGAGWATLTFDVESVVQKNVVVNAATNTLTFTQDGVWAVSLTFTVEHNSSNQGRRFDVRLFDETDGMQIGGMVTVGVGRNTEVSNFANINLLFLLDAQENHPIHVEVGNTSDSFTSVEWQIANWAVWSVGEYPDDIP